MTKENDNKPYIHHSEYRTRALIKGFKRLESDTIVAELALMSGKDQDGNQHYQNGSFFVSKSVSYFASKQLDTFYGDKGVVANVVISDFQAGSAPNEKKPEKPYTNYRGFLNEITFG